MAPDPFIRPYAASDLPALQRIRAAAFAPVFASFRAILGAEIGTIALADAEGEQAALLVGICAAESEHEVLVAAVGGEAAGFASFTVDVGARIGEIGLNAVHPDFAGRGIGTLLYEAALARMKAMGAAVACVGTGGDASHAPARRAYEKAGFGPALPSLHLYRLL